jgi:transposase
VARPDHIVAHPLDRCTCGLCGGASLRQQPVLDYEKRQVFELPHKPLEVTEHRAEIKRCPVSGAVVVAAFPQQVKAPAQYGPRFRGQMVYFNQEHALPYTRLTRICQDLYGQPLSEATVVAANERTYENLVPFEGMVRVLLPQAPALNLDESGLRVAGKLHWLHVISNASLTFYGVHPQRGREAMDYFDILTRCTHFVIHDHFKAYFSYTNCLHALCNEHHLRELKFMAEQEHQAWAGQMSRFLLDCLARRKTDGVLSDKQFKKLHARYRAILRKGRLLHPRKQGGGAQSKAANLLDRLEDFDLHVLAFSIFEEVPFTNNGAERDIRMVKTRQKISGCFRTLHGARVFARIRSYISTCRKQGRNILDELENAVLERPFIPSAPPAGP